jgi:hypothetical protein
MTMDLAKGHILVTKSQSNYGAVILQSNILGDAVPVN